MFYGEYEHALDAKDRVIIPAKFREVFKEHYVEKFFITRGLDQCLFLFTEEEWRSQEKKFKSLSFTSPACISSSALSGKVALLFVALNELS